MRLYQINQTKEGVVGNWLVAFWSEIQIYKIQKYLDFWLALEGVSVGKGCGVDTLVGLSP